MIRAAQARAARKRYREMAPVLNEQSRRRFVALEAQALGRGGVSLMARISGLARRTIYHGLSDVRDQRSAGPGRVRGRGGGRKPLRSYRTIVQLIAATTTEAGLKVRAKLDEKKYPKGIKVSDAQLAAVNLAPHVFHGDWNYTISPSRAN